VNVSDMQIFQNILKAILNENNEKQSKSTAKEV
jgi:hypothetical protein